MTSRMTFPTKRSGTPFVGFILSLVYLALQAPPHALAEPRSPAQAAAKTESRTANTAAPKPKSKPKSKPTTAAPSSQSSAQRPYQELSVATMRQLQNSMISLREYSNHFSAYPHLMNAPDTLDALEGIATEAVLSQIILSTYTEALRRGWQKTARVSVLPIHEIAGNSGATLGFNSRSARVAVFGLQSGRFNRGVILTANYDSLNPGDLRTQFGQATIFSMVDNAKLEYNAFALEILDRMKDANRRLSEYLPVVGQAQTWSLGCETTVAGQFCVNMRVFDAIDTDSRVFYDALHGQPDPDERIRAIKAQNLAWPVKASYISRGYKVCNKKSCSPHYGLDLATPMNTYIHSVQDGVVAINQKLRGWGKTIVIKHKLPNGDTYVSLYAHLSRNRKDLKVGATVKKGDLIALSGNTGASSGPHLHLEIRHANGDKEPLEMLKRSEDERPLDPLRVLDVFNIFVADAEQK